MAKIILTWRSGAQNVDLVTITVGDMAPADLSSTWWEVEIAHRGFRTAIEAVRAVDWWTAVRIAADRALKTVHPEVVSVLVLMIPASPCVT